MSTFKKGEMAGVILAEDVRDQKIIWVSRPGGKVDFVRVDTLHPLPVPDPLTALERAVVDAADAWRDTVLRGGHVSNRDALADAVDALRAARKPKAPEDVFAQAFGESWRVQSGMCKFWSTSCFTSISTCECRAAVTAAIAAVEAAR